MADFVIGQHTYRSGRLDAFQQFHIVRKIAPITATLAPALKAISEGIGGLQSLINATGENATPSDLGGVIGDGTPSSKNLLMNLNIEELSYKLGPVLNAVAGLPEDDCNFVIHTCISVTKRKQGDAWASMYNVSAKRIMFDDIQLVELLQICINVLTESLSSFFPAPPSDSVNQGSLPNGLSPGQLSRRGKTT